MIPKAMQRYQSFLRLMSVVIGRYCSELPLRKSMVLVLKCFKNTPLSVGYHLIVIHGQNVAAEAPSTGFRL